MFIRSQRLFLRPSWPEDWQELYARVNDEAIVRNLARVPWPYRPNDARQFAGSRHEPRYPHFLVTLPAARGALVGSIGLDRHGGETELGYWIARDHWGRGYATEAALAVLPIARLLGHRRLVASVFSENAASRRVLEKVGFRPTGERRGRFCRARGEDVCATSYSLELGDPCDCGPSDGDGELASRERMAA